MQEYIRKDRNGAELKIGERVNVHHTGKVVGSGEVSLPQYYTEWANKEDTVWIKWETAPRDFEENIGHILWSWTTDIEKIIVKEEIKSAAPHVHAELIKMWADDPSIKFQYQPSNCDEWGDVPGTPYWNADFKYRVKPKEKKFVDKYYYTYKNSCDEIVTTTKAFSDEEWGNFIKDLNIEQYVKLHFSLTKVEIKED